jgi:multisubunit Na+/H+ antiporter MnhB subunit
VTLPESIQDETRCTAVRFLIALFALAITGALGWAVWSLPQDGAGLTEPALGQLTNSGVTNPVTAAVLNYRGYDTLLEIAVLLLAVLGVWSVAKAERVADSPPASPVLLSFIRLAVPLMILIAGYLLWIGAFAPGGAFQGGAVLAAALVLLRLGGIPLPHWLSGRRLRLGLVLGLAVFVVIAAVMMAIGGKLLEYPRAHAGSLIMLIESTAMVSIGLTLAALFAGGRPEDDTPCADKTPSR